MSLPQIAMSFRRVHVVMKPVLESPGTRKEFSPVPVRGKSEVCRPSSPRLPDLLGPPSAQQRSEAPQPPRRWSRPERAKPRDPTRRRSPQSRARGGRGALTLGFPVCLLGCDLSAEHNLGNSSQNLHCFNSGSRRERNQGLETLTQP